MQMKSIEQIILTADEGKWLTDGETFGKTVVIPSGSDTSVWREIAEGEKDAMEQAQLEAAESLTGSEVIV